VIVIPESLNRIWERLRQGKAEPGTSAVRDKLSQGQVLEFG